MIWYLWIQSWILLSALCGSLYANYRSNQKHENEKSELRKIAIKFSDDFFAEKQLRQWAEESRDHYEEYWIQETTHKQKLDSLLNEIKAILKKDNINE